MNLLGNYMSLSVMEQSDSGGPAALKGFTYQNFAAAYYVLTMLRDKSLISVRCEVIDDIDLVYNNRIEYVQVKTTDNDSKWTVKEFSEASTKMVPPVRPQRVDQKVSLEDSILHKSILCDKVAIQGYFRILTPRDVTKDLLYLKVLQASRDGKYEARAQLLKKLRQKVELNRPKDKPEFISPNDNNIEYWLDHSEWTVVSPGELELQCTKIILQSAQQNSIYLNANGDPERILASLLNSLTKKGAASRVLNAASDKSYHRREFITWFNAEIEYYTSISNEHVKVYSTNSSKLNAILSKFFYDDKLYKADNFDGDKVCAGLQGSYHRSEYQYDQIAKSLFSWLPEVLLHPSEIADHAASYLTDKVSTFIQRYNQQVDEINKLIAKVLLHSTIRTEYKSQPIAANLYIDDYIHTCFDNIHILLDDHGQDKLLMGFSILLEGDVEESLSKIVQDFDNLLGSEAFGSQKDKILEAKENNYLLQHDIDNILKPNCALDEHIDRFRFVFFIGYESEHLECNKKKMKPDYPNDLKLEVESKFKALIGNLLSESDFYENLHIEVYLYPIPSLTTLINTIQHQVKSQWKLT